jgi:hypothetical protein
MTIPNPLTTQIEGLSSEALQALSDLANQELQKRIASTVATELPTQFTDLKVPNYILVTFVEHLYTCFIEELFNNYPEEEDYTTDDPTKLSNNNAIKITNSFNRIDYKDGQYPKIIVQAQGSNPSKQFIGNDSPYKNSDPYISTKKNEKSAYFQVPVSITVLTQNYNEANILASLLQMALLENFDVLQRVFGFNYVTEPQMSSARKVRDVDDVFAADISFVNGKYVQWSHLIGTSNYRAIIYRLVAKVSKTDGDDSINHFISLLQGMPLDPQLKEYIQLKYGMDGI